MLTKEERAAIAERANRAKYSMDSIFEILHGYSSPEYMSLKDDFIAMVTRVLDLCDTSNMLELPVDKDGEYIRLGDVVYDDEATEYKAVGYSTHSAGTNIIVEYGKNFGFRTQIFSDELTHKQPVTVKSLAQRVRGVLDGICNTEYAVEELSDIAMQLERLGDNDE